MRAPMRGHNASFGVQFISINVKLRANFSCFCCRVPFDTTERQPTERKPKIYVGFIAYDRIRIVQELEGRFEESVIAYLFLINILPILIIPMIWIETGKFTDVLNNWTEFEVFSGGSGGKSSPPMIADIWVTKWSSLSFQIIYYKVSGRVLPLNIRTKALLIAILLPALSSLSVLITHLTMSEFKLFQVRTKVKRVNSRKIAQFFAINKRCGY